MHGRPCLAAPFPTCNIGELHGEICARCSAASGVGGREAASRRVERQEWRDPDDTNPLRGQARTVSGYRRVDSLALLLRRGSITRKRVAANAALRLGCGQR